MAGPRSTRRRSRASVVLLAVAVGVYAGAVTEAAIGLIFRTPWDWAEMAGRSLAPAIGWGLVWWLQDLGWFPTREGHRRRQGAPDTLGAIATGVLPPDADPGRWRPWLEQDGRELDQVRWLTLALWVPGGALVAVAGVVAHDAPWAIWALAAALVATGLVLFRRSTRVVVTAHRLLDEL